MSGKRGVHVFDGLTLPDFVTQERLNNLESFKLFEDDVFVDTYPKCGTTWTLQILKLLRTNGQQDNTDLPLSVPWLEDTRLSVDWDKVIKPRGFKSHMPYDRFPFGNPQDLPCKFIYVIRDPKDVATSFYYHLRSSLLHPMEKEEYFGKFMNGTVEFGSYFDHVLSWWEHREDRNVLVLRYEDMKKDLISCISQISVFIGANVSDEVISTVADQTEFSSMKNNPLANNERWREKMNGETDFMRKGIVGDWKNFLSPQQSAEIDALCASRLSPVGLQFD